MLAQVFGTVFESLFVAGRTVLAATGRTDDNPVVVAGEVLTSGGSLPLDTTLFLQTAQLALAHAARAGTGGSTPPTVRSPRKSKPSRTSLGRMRPLAD